MEYTILILLLPFLSFLALGLGGKWMSHRTAGLIGTAALGVVAVLSYLTAGMYFSAPRLADGTYEALMPYNFKWLPFTESLSIDMGILLDPISVMMLVVISTVSLLVHIYSFGYMKGERGFQRYYAFLSLFTMSMLGLVVATNIFQMYLFWELVGVSSYLLIGFYYTKPAAIAASKKAFIVTDQFLYKNGYTKCVTDKLDSLGIMHTTFYNVAPDPTLACAKEGTAAMRLFEPDVIIAIGGGSAMDAAKIMWVMYEHPEADFLDMAMRFMDIRKRIYTFPKMGEKAYFVAISTSSGTGSEVTPFAVITDETTGQKYPLADYELLPKMAIIDADMHMNQPKGLTAASGIDALTHALEAYASIMATEYTDGLALQAMKNIFEYLPAAYELGAHDAVAREKMATASTMAGMAFANAFLGVCHSLAHKLGAYHHLPHGIANALLITDVMRFNAAEVPTKMGTFSQYQYPHCKARYVECADFLGIQGKDDDEKFENLIKAIEELKAKVGIKKTIADYGVKEEDFLATLDEMTEAAFDDQCTGANPRYPLMSEMKAMYLKAYYGK